jgi:hypothetical protein
MTELENYEALQEYNNFQRLVYTKEYLTKDEYNFCVEYDKDSKKHLIYVGYGDGMTYLNLNVYSEHDHEKRGYEMEIG